MWINVPLRISPKRSGIISHQRAYSISHKNWLSDENSRSRNHGLIPLLYQPQARSNSCSALNLCRVLLASLCDVLQLQRMKQCRCISYFPFGTARLCSGTLSPLVSRATGVSPTPDCGRDARAGQPSSAKALILFRPETAQEGVKCIADTAAGIFMSCFLLEPHPPLLVSRAMSAIDVFPFYYLLLPTTHFPW